MCSPRRQGLNSYCDSFLHSTWGETLFIGIQVVIILVLMLVLTGNLHMVAMFLPLYGAIIWFLTSEYVSIALLATCQGMVIPLFLSSRVSKGTPVLCDQVLVYDASPC